jgi:hypothetical protein
MGLLVGLHVVAAALDGVEHGSLDVEELAVIREPAVRRPELEHDIQHFGRAGPHGGRIRRVQTEQREIGRDGAPADSPLKTATGQVVEHGQSMRQVDGVVEGQEGDAGPEPHSLGQLQGLGDEQVGGGGILPALRQMLTDPRLAKAELIGQDDLVDVSLVGIGERAMRRVEGHHEQPEVHASRLLRGG